MGKYVPKVGDTVRMRDNDHGAVAVGTYGVVRSISTTPGICTVRWEKVRNDYFDDNTVPMFNSVLEFVGSPAGLPLTVKRKLVL